MADLLFAQPARRNLVLPFVLTLLISAAAIFALLRFTPHRTADLVLEGTAVYAAHTVFKSESTVVGRDAAQDDLYVVAEVALTDRLRLPVFLDDITATLTPSANDAAGNAVLTTSAVEKSDLANLYTSFPQVKKLADAAGSPLLRETKLNPGQTARGFVILHFPVPEATWDNRQDATLLVTLYHQPPLTIVIPKQSSGHPTAAAAAAKKK